MQAARDSQRSAQQTTGAGSTTPRGAALRDQQTTETAAAAAAARMMLVTDSLPGTPVEAGGSLHMQQPTYFGAEGTPPPYPRQS